MNPRVRSIVFALCLLSSAVIYLYALDRVPVYLGLDEAHFAVHARAIADTGRNLNGDPFPLFVNLADPLGDQPTLAWGASWYHPLLFYLIALALKVLPFTEASVRTPTALIAGVVNVFLMYAVAIRLFRTRWIAVAAASMLALTPAHLVLGRQALDYIWPLPFQLAWLWCLLAFRDTERVGFALAAGLILGIGCYSYVSSWVLMPAFLGLSWLVYRQSRIGARLPFSLAIAGFAIPLLPLVPWLWSHPQMIDNLLHAQSISAVETFGHGLPVVNVMQRTFTTYWSYFNPAFLFLTGGPSLNAATGQAGVFLLPIAILLPIGIAAMFKTRADAMPWVLLLGVLITPIPATLKGMPHVVQRTLTLLPFVVLIASGGLWALWQSSSRMSRCVAIALLVAMPAQFAFFYADYLTGYRLRSAAAYDRTAFAETARVLLDAESAGGVPQFYLTAPLYDVSAKWRFYATKAGRTDLLSRTRYFDGNLSNLGEVAPNSLAVLDAESASVDGAVAAGEWSVEKRVLDVSGRSPLLVLRKLRR